MLHREPHGDEVAMVPYHAPDRAAWGPVVVHLKADDDLRYGERICTAQDDVSRFNV